MKNWKTLSRARQALLVAFTAICLVAVGRAVQIKAGSMGIINYSLDTTDGANQIILVPTSTTISVNLADVDYTIFHTGYYGTNTGTSSNTSTNASTDAVYWCNQKTAAGSNVTLNAVNSPGNKNIVYSGAAATFNGSIVPDGSDGPREIQLKAVGNPALVSFIRGHKGP